MVISFLILIGITYFWYKQHGPNAAAAGLLGFTALTTVGSTLPWWVVLPLAFWLGHIVRHWNDKPEPKISDTNNG